MASKTGSPWHDVLFSWIHLSDIHIGHGDAAHGWDQKLVLKVLRDDATRLIAEGRVPPPDALLVTGDVAFSGATRSREEYAGATEWLLSIAAAAGLTKEDVFIVPGNHDVQRRADKDDKAVGTLVRRIRNGDVSLDAALGDKAQVALLRKRMARYLTFAAGFAPACRPDAAGPKKPFWWTHRRSVADGLKVRIASLNTALLAADSKDQGKLRLGKAQLSQALIDDDDDATVVVALSHHPFRAGWLADEDEVSSWARNHAHIHLSGHVHVADAVQTVSSGGKSFLHVSAGAAHGDAQKGVPPSHGYNVAALVRAPGGKVQLAVWPRRWSPGGASFVVDVFNVHDGSERSLHDVVGVQLPAPAAATPARSTGAGLVELLDDLPVTSEFSGRSELLDGIGIASSLNRNQDNKTLDLQKIVSQLRRRKMPDRRPCLAVLIDNALRFAGDTDLAAALREEQARLDR
jgi:hypothetical protein